MTINQLDWSEGSRGDRYYALFVLGQSKLKKTGKGVGAAYEACPYT